MDEVLRNRQCMDEMLRNNSMSFMLVIIPILGMLHSASIYINSQTSPKLLILHIH